MTLVKRHSKYNAKKTTYNGEVYDSQMEAMFASNLEMGKRAIDIKDRVIKVVRQPEFVVTIEGKKICAYRGDFLVTYGDDRVVLYDVKGFKTPEYILKKKLVEAIYKIKIIEVTKSKKTA